MSTGRTDFDVTKGLLSNKHYSRKFNTVNFLETTFISQPARSDIKIDPAGTHGNKLLVAFVFRKKD